MHTFAPKQVIKFAPFGHRTSLHSAVYGGRQEPKHPDFELAKE